MKRKCRRPSDLLLEPSHIIVVEGLLVSKRMENALKTAEDTWNDVSTPMNQMKRVHVMGLFQKQQQQLTFVYSTGATLLFP